MKQSSKAGLANSHSCFYQPPAHTRLFWKVFVQPISRIPRCPRSSQSLRYSKHDQYTRPLRFLPPPAPPPHVHGGDPLFLAKKNKTSPRGLVEFFRSQYTSHSTPPPPERRPPADIETENSDAVETAGRSRAGTIPARNPRPLLSPQPDRIFGNRARPVVRSQSVQRRSPPAMPDS